MAASQALVILLMLVAVTEVRSELRAVLVGVSDYPTLPAGVQRTPGARNDVELLRATLRQRGFASDRIRVLADGVRDAERPTRANILRALDELVESSEPGDLVYLHFAGHGSMEPGLRPREGASPIFLPIDIGRWDGGVGRVDNAITRLDLRERVDRIADRGAFVWGVFDTCHAATLVRQADQSLERPRFVKPSLLGVPRGASSPGVHAPVSATGMLESRSRPAPGRGGTVLFYAAQAGESTVELPLPRGATSARRHGLFSFHVAVALQSRRPMSYRQLGQAILAAYGGTPEAYSTPLFSGDALDHLVLGQHAAPVWQWPLRVEGGLQVDAGSLSGLTPGAVLAVVGAPTAAEREVMGHLRVVTAEIGRATLEPVAHAGGAAIDSTALRSGQYLRLIYSPPAFALRVAYEPRGCASGCGVNAAVERLRQVGAQGVDLQWVESAEHADVLVRPRMGRVDLLAPAHRQGPASGDIDSPGFDLDPKESVVELSSRLGQGLHAVAKSRNLMALASRMMGESPATGLTIVLRHVRRPGDPGEIVRPETVPRLFSGDAIAVTLGNTGPQALDVTVLHLDAHHGVKVLYPGQNGESNRLPAGTSRRVDDLVVRVPPGGLERLLVIGRQAMPGSERSDFSFLSQRSLSRTRTALDKEVEVFADAAFAEYRRHGLRHARAPRGAIDMQVFSFDVRASRRPP